MSKDVQFNFRLPAELKAALEQAAAANKRTTSSEAVNRLHDSFQDPLDREAPPEWIEIVAERDRLKAQAVELVRLLQQTQQALLDSQSMNLRLLSEREAQQSAAKSATKADSGKVKA